jgi:DNA-binding transcriptional ArsR family regulator
VKWIWLGLGCLVALSVGVERVLGLAPVFLFLGALALGVGLYFAWQSLLSVESEAPMDFDEAIAFAAPTLAEEEKLAILRALKDLEYERTVGKISEADFASVLADYRERAKASIQLADQSLEEGRKKALEWTREWEKTREERRKAAPPSAEVAEPRDAAESESTRAESSEAAESGSPAKAPPETPASEGGQL